MINYKKLLGGAFGAGLYLLSASSVLAADGVDLCNTSFQGTGGLCGVDIPKLVSTALNVLLFVAFIAALVFLIIGGIRWIISGGDKEATGKAKGTVTAALVGLAVVLGSWILINIVLNFFGITGGTNNIPIPQLITK